jgi:hypothetical protein
VDVAEATALSPAIDAAELSPTSDRLATAEEMIDSGESRYARLAIWLSKQPGRTKEVQLRFDDIESIIGGELPPSARQHRAWWANDTVSHVQSKEWLDAGWRVTYINLSEQRVTFVRTKDRESAYIAFFSNLLEKVRQDGRTPTKGLSPDGQGWYVFAGVPVGGREAWNKRTFDLLQAQAE